MIEHTSSMSLFGTSSTTSSAMAKKTKTETHNRSARWSDFPSNTTIATWKGAAYKANSTTEAQFLGVPKNCLRLAERPCGVAVAERGGCDGTFKFQRGSCFFFLHFEKGGTSVRCMQFGERGKVIFLERCFFEGIRSLKLLFWAFA